MLSLDELVKKFDFVPLVPEGGYVKEMHTGEVVNGRASYSTILYLMTPESYSNMHKLEDDEVWFYHDGPSVEMLLIYNDHSEIRVLGKDYEHGECPQILVPAGVWQGAHMKHPGEYTLVSTSVVPAYDQKNFTLGSYDELKEKTTHLDLLKELTKA